MKMPLTDAAISAAKRAPTPIVGSAYRRLYLAILDGRLSGERVAGRWHVELSDADAVLGIEKEAA